MLPYWLLFIFPALPAIFAGSRVQSQRNNIGRTDNFAPWLLVILIFTFLIGWRFQVGGDWAQYLRYLNGAVGLSIYDAIQLNDPGYWIFNVIAIKTGWGIIGVNALSGFVFAVGLIFFCRSLPLPWLGLAVAVPYMVIVVGMGYSRQAVALGLAMLGLVALERNNYLGFIISVLLGATFHKTAVLLLPIAALTVTRNRYQAAVVVIVATLIGYKVLLEDSVDTLIANYIDTQYQSSGALIRLAMNAVPSALFLFYYKYFRIPPAAKKLWLLFSIIAICLFVMFFYVSSTTALDRMALYLIPIQIFVFSHLPFALGRNGRQNRVISISILLYYALVLFVWLNFADNSRYWLPYRLNI